MKLHTIFQTQNTHNSVDFALCTVGVLMRLGTAIVVMAKQPWVGKSKTRLCPPFTFEEAAGMYDALMRDTIELAAGVENTTLAVAVTPVGAVDYFGAITPAGTLLLPVEAADIGGCLERVFEDLFDMGFHKVMAINSDGPSLPRCVLSQALGLLESHDVVFGPAHDGGYYLVGLKQPHPLLFRGIPWSTDLVLTESLAQAATLGLRAAQTRLWYDVDTAAEVRELAEELRGLQPDQLAHTRRFLARLRPALLE
jgi:rSAM/selenodomain-associated transferase 1